MDIEGIEKIVLPIKASPEIMELLIKAKHFFAHAVLHSKTGNSFDSMISIHSIDNAIEYLLRIVIKHLEIEQKLSKTINTPELMGLFGEVDKFLKEYTLFDGKSSGLPYENEIRQLRTLRNNVQHGMILPTNELRNIIKYGDKFFERVLKKIFGLTLQDISYSSLIENGDIKNHLVSAEERIADGSYLEAVVACRDAFELGEFMLRNDSHHINKMIAIPHIKQESMELYYYIQSIDEELSVLGTNINISDYRLFSRYVDYIPIEYRGAKSGCAVMQRPWEKRDAEFCYSFVAQAILGWQLNQEKPLYEVDRSAFDINRRNFSINGTVVPELYPQKSCIYLGDNGQIGELLFLPQQTKDELEKIAPGDVCRFEIKITNERTGLVFREYSVYVIMDALEFNLVLNNGPLWELIMFYREIPFTTTPAIEKEIDIDNIESFEPCSGDEEQIKNTILAFGPIDSIERAFELNALLTSQEVTSFGHLDMISSNLIQVVEQNRTN